MKLLKILLSIFLLHFIFLNVNAQKFLTNEVEIYLYRDNQESVLQQQGSNYVEIDIDRYENRIYVDDLDGDKLYITIEYIQIKGNVTYFFCAAKNNEKLLIVHDSDRSTIGIVVDNPDKSVRGTLVIMRKILRYERF